MMLGILNPFLPFAGIIENFVPETTDPNLVSPVQYSHACTMCTINVTFSEKPGWGFFSVILVLKDVGYTLSNS